MSGQEKIYQMVTEKVLALLESGVAPWRKPWSHAGGGMPFNLKSKKPYRGCNVFMLAAQGYSSRYWASMKQVNERGGKVRKGEKGTPVVFWKPFEVRDKSSADPEAMKKVPLLRYFYVWNLDQCDGLEDPDGVQESRPYRGRVERADDIAGMYCSNQGVEVRIGGGRAYYSPREDFIGIPPLDSFPVVDEYHSTLFHEIIHSTGHVARLGLPGVVDTVRFGSEKYGQEELVAEMGAAFLCAEAGIDSTVDNSASYLSGWIQTIKGDPRMVVVAAAKAQKAADLVLGLNYQGD